MQFSRSDFIVALTSSNNPITVYVFLGRETEGDFEWASELLRSLSPSPSPSLNFPDPSPKYAIHQVVGGSISLTPILTGESGNPAVMQTTYANFEWQWTGIGLLSVERSLPLFPL